IAPGTTAPSPLSLHDALPISLGDTGRTRSVDHVNDVFRRVFSLRIGGWLLSQGGLVSVQANDLARKRRQTIEQSLVGEDDTGLRSEERRGGKEGEMWCGGWVA